LARLRAAVDAELRAKDAAIDVDSPGRSSVERLAALFELTAAETERGFDPSAYGVSESEALRLAALFADDDGDGFVGAEELGRLLRELNRVAWEEDDARGGGGGFAEPIKGPSVTRPSTSFDSSDVDFADPAEVSAAFDALDGDGDGRVSLEAFVAWVRLGGRPVAANADVVTRVVGAIGEETPAEEAAVEAIRD
jgi:Ca2+-binding EF-hand superfamily protein